MPAATTRGYPYPLGPDPIDVAGDIQALAEAIDLDVVKAVKVYANTTDLATTAPRINGNVVFMADGTQWRYDGTRWVRTYSPPGTWQTIAPLSPNTSLGTPPGPLQVRTNNGYIEFRGGQQMNTLGSNSLVGLLPAGHLPEVEEWCNPGVYPLNGDASNEFWSSYAVVPASTSSYITLQATASAVNPWYGNVRVVWGGVRLAQAPVTVA